MDYLLSYGSLMNRHSRETYSGIFGDVIPVEVKGWSRGWCTRYPDESATYAGAFQNRDSRLNAVLIATQLNDQIRERERNYRFTEIYPHQLEIVSAASNDYTANHYWICETIEPGEAVREMPLPQSYVDTCLLGCLESGGEAAVAEFIQQTSGWKGVWVDDRAFERPIYPRYTPVSVHQRLIIDRLLEESGVLQYRELPK